MTGDARITVCLVSSHGGHLRELLDATRGVIGEKYYVTCRTRHTEELLGRERHYFVMDPHVSKWKYVVNAVQSVGHLLRQRPDVVISTGAGIAIPTILMCRYLLGAKVVFIESAANVNHPSRTGMFVYRLADLFLVQWEGLTRYYPNAVHVGLL